MANLQFNNTRNHGVYVRCAIDGGDFSRTDKQVHCGRRATTTVPLDVETFRELKVRVQTNNKWGNGIGDLHVRLANRESSDGGTYLLGRPYADENAALLLLRGKDVLGAISGKVASSS